MTPLVSVIIPAYRAGATLATAVASVFNAGLATEDIEIVIESDDGHDYPAVACLPAVQLAVTGMVASGCGPARNRAMARARGAYLVFLDADDRFSPGYLAALLPLARAEGAAVAPMQMHEGEEVILRLWQDQARLGFADLAASGASLRLMVGRGQCPPFVHAPAQDILHGVQVMAAQGGSLPLSEVPYHLCQTPGSITAAPDFSARVAQAYEDHLARLLDDPQMPVAAADVFRAKIALNAAYEAQGAGRSYYRFIADGAA